MDTARIRMPRKALMLVGCLVALSLGLITGPASAQASTSSYCGGTLSSRAWCAGATRWLYQTYGWGDQGGVCVAVSGYASLACTNAANTGVYSANVGSNVWTQPTIQNNTGYPNYVHGVALTH
jgi:hypothetical protein